MSVSPEIRALARNVVAREPRAVARAISVVEDRRGSSEPTIVDLLRELEAQGDRLRCHRVGLTGPPGVGKSTLVSSLAKAARGRGRTVGVLAVDPSSPRSGGALLGDRARIEIDPDDAGLFVRSMASGGELGGLARAAGAAIDVLSFAYDWVIVETTGVGQSETDVEHVADTVVLVIQPGSGDVLQFLKAGIIEIPDVFVVNKSDLGAIAQRAVTDLNAALSAVHVGGDPTSAMPEVVATSASTSKGVDELVEGIDRHWDVLARTDGLRRRRENAACQWAFRLCVQRFGEYGVRRAGGKLALSDLLRRRIQAGASAVEAVLEAKPACVGS